MDPITATKRGDVEFLRQIKFDVLQDYRDEYGISALSSAAVQGSLSCCEEILKKCPSLLYQRCNHGTTPLHQAAWNNQLAVIEFLVSVSATTEQLREMESGIRPDDNSKLLTMATFNKSTALHHAVRKGHLEAAKLLIQADPSNKLLRMVDKDGNTAMHIVVKTRNLGLVKLLVETDPDFEYCANVIGHTPLFIAFQEALAGDETAVEIRKLLIRKQPSQCKARVGHNNWTLLHHAAYKGDLSFIEDIIHFCPECLDLVDNDLQNFLHLAIKFERVNVVKHIFGMQTIGDGVLNGQDNHGNTPLHIAAIGQNAKMAVFFLYDFRVCKTIMNMQGLKAIDIIHFEYDKRKAGVYGLVDRVGDKEIIDQTDFDLLVGALIATVSFTAGITVPGGYRSDGPNEGTAVLAKKLSFKLFTISNTIALLLSLYAVFSHFCVKRLHMKEDIIYQLNMATNLLLIRGHICNGDCLHNRFIYLVLAITEEFSITVCVLCCCFFLFAFHSLWKMLLQDKPLTVNA